MTICSVCFAEWSKKEHRFCPHCGSDSVLPPGETGKVKRFDAQTGRLLGWRIYKFRYEVMAALLAIGVLVALGFAVFGLRAKSPSEPSVVAAVETETVSTASKPQPSNAGESRLPMVQTGKASSETVRSVGQATQVVKSAERAPVTLVEVPKAKENEPIKPATKTVVATATPVQLLPTPTIKAPDIKPPPKPSDPPKVEVPKTQPAPPDPKPVIAVKPADAPATKPAVAAVVVPERKPVVVEPPAPPKKPPVDVATLLRSGQAAQQANKLDAALDAYKQVLAAQPNSVEARQGKSQTIEAMYQLGQRYAGGQEVKRDLFQAAGWYRKAAEQGHMQAQRALGRCYTDGLGVEKNTTMAQAWYRQAAAQYRTAADRGEAEAQNILGEMYEARNGEQGVTRDYERAYHWYQLAAHQGYPAGETNLALMYRDGLGVAADRKAAVFWLRLAARQNEPEAQKLLKEMDEKW